MLGDEHLNYIPPDLMHGRTLKRAVDLEYHYVMAQLRSVLQLLNSISVTKNTVAEANQRIANLIEFMFTNKLYRNAATDIETLETIRKMLDARGYVQSYTWAEKALKDDQTVPEKRGEDK